MVQFGFSKIVQSCKPLVLLYLQDFENWFVEVPIYCYLVTIGLGLIASKVTANTSKYSSIKGI